MDTKLFRFGRSLSLKIAHAQVLRVLADTPAHTCGRGHRADARGSEFLPALGLCERRDEEDISASRRTHCQEEEKDVIFEMKPIQPNVSDAS
ncbi:hypothetical protein CYMTET_13769 [Cymbomonas tetramitiformis]|uniref:Uncharacterized protein n=1 Tax=Cymbomonas tetramitiformis TaxID=36881 RepID=A0AAE0GHP7_9CHLO|nr:hypothetical protein CYMTET_13769 [Cymbomonas tetramitiformis]